MRLKKLKNADEILENSKYLIKDPSKYKGKWNKIFNNNNPIYIEIGMGKGKFILENARRNPNINYIGIEKFDTVMAKAIKGIENHELSNLKLIKIDASELENIFNKEIDKIYLNFSDPWPKDRHEKRRLTYKSFLNIYDKLFQNKSVIELKTDNKGLFEYSIVSLNNYGYLFKSVNVDLHNSNECDIITTEYEDRFIKLNNPIYKVVCEKESI